MKYKDPSTPEQRSILFLDQVKAYDRVSHQFMWAILRHMEIPEEYISWIQILYRDATTRPFVNNYFGDAIPLKGGVR